MKNHSVPSWFVAAMVDAAFGRKPQFTRQQLIAWAGRFKVSPMAEALYQV